MDAFEIVFVVVPIVAPEPNSEVREAFAAPFSTVVRQPGVLVLASDW